MTQALSFGYKYDKMSNIYALHLKESSAENMKICISLGMISQELLLQSFHYLKRKLLTVMDIWPRLGKEAWIH